VERRSEVARERRVVRMRRVIARFIFVRFVIMEKMERSICSSFLRFIVKKRNVFTREYNNVLFLKERDLCSLFSHS